MSFDHTLLQIMRERKKFYQLKRMLNPKSVDSHTLAILNAYDQFFKLDVDCHNIPVDDGFQSWFFLSKGDKLGDEARAILTAVFRQASKEPNEFAKKQIVKQILQADLAVKTTDIMDRYHNDEDIDPAAELGLIFNAYHIAMEGSSKKFEFVELDEDLFLEDTNNEGLQPRWPSLQMYMRPWRGGDFLIFAARPDSGKTSAIADNITFMGPQVQEYNAATHAAWLSEVQAAADMGAASMPEPQPRIILWLNNEGPGKRILKRVVQAAFGIPMSKIIEKQNAGTLWQEYEVLMGGNRHVIKVKDIHGWSASMVEELIKDTNPMLVVYDMIDNIQFTNGVSNGGTRTDQLLEAMYAWGRNMAVIYDHVGLATSQTSADAAEKSFPLMHMLKDSKTGKQGACDAIIMMGNKEEDATQETSRWISTPKNKLSIEGMGKSPRAETIFDYATSRFHEATVVGSTDDV
jgi:replicative DNA helicase